MVEFVSEIIGALAAGAIGKASGIGGQVVADAYDGLKGLAIRRLGKSGAVQSVEEEPRSEAAQTALAEAMAKAKITTDTEMAQLAEEIRGALGSSDTQDGAEIEVGDIFGKIDVLVSDLVASGRIKLGSICAEEGNAILTNVRAGLKNS